MGAEEQQSVIFSFWLCSHQAQQHFPGRTAGMDTGTASSKPSRASCAAAARGCCTLFGTSVSDVSTCFSPMLLTSVLCGRQGDTLAAWAALTELNQRHQVQVHSRRNISLKTPPASISDQIHKPAGAAGQGQVVLTLAVSPFLSSSRTNQGSGSKSKPLCSTSGLVQIHQM